MIDLALKGIEYFQTYYQNLLLFTVSAAMVGWMIFLVQQLKVQDDLVSSSFNKSIWSILKWIVFVVAFSLIAYGKLEILLLCKVSLLWVWSLTKLIFIQLNKCHLPMEYFLCCHYFAGIQFVFIICCAIWTRPTPGSGLLALNY